MPGIPTHKEPADKFVCRLFNVKNVMEHSGLEPLTSTLPV